MNSLVNVNWDSKLPIYEISHLKLQNKGIKSLLIDVDGTLLSRQSNIIPKNVKNWIKESKKLFSIYLISNNPSNERIRKIAKELDIRCKSNALKPRKKITLDIISEMSGASTLRMATKKAGPVVTDQGNLILDVLFNGGIKDPKALEILINNIPGVLENGLFVDLTDKVLVGKLENNIPKLFSPSKKS